MATKPMTKTQLVAALADDMGADKKSAGAALDAVCNLITREVSGGGAVTLPGVGKIYCRERPELWYWGGQAELEGRLRRPFLFALARISMPCMRVTLLPLRHPPEPTASA